MLPTQVWHVEVFIWKSKMRRLQHRRSLLGSERHHQLDWCYPNKLTQSYEKLTDHTQCSTKTLGRYFTEIHWNNSSGQTWKHTIMLEFKIIYFFHPWQSCSQDMFFFLVQRFKLTLIRKPFFWQTRTSESTSLADRKFSSKVAPFVAIKVSEKPYSNEEICEVISYKKWSYQL